MPELNLERAGRDRPLLRLPPSGSMAFGAPPVEIFVELSKAESGCYICRRPIPSGTSRVAFKVTVELEDSSAQGLLDLKTRRQKYTVHPGCLTKPMGSEIRRHGTDCWDCGALGIDGDNRENPQGWSYCFTTHKFAWGLLCGTCQGKPRWRACGNCGVFYPLHMVLKGELANPRRITLGIVDTEEPRQERGDWCLHCIDRFEVSTTQQMKDARDEFEQIRRRIMEQGVFEE